MVILLLSIIACSEILRLVLTHRPLTNRRYFRNKLDGVEKLILDLEFAKFKTSEVREDIRREYDSMKSRLDELDIRIKAGKKPDEDQGEFNRLDDQKVLFTRDIGRLEEQLKRLDLEIHGSKKTSEYPDGATGITQKIEELRGLAQILKIWIKSI